jgi:photosystem II stability/assembly factor-like uncharacterized protein
VPKWLSRGKNPSPDSAAAEGSQNRRVLKVMGRTVATSAGAIFLVVLLAAVLATSVAVVAVHALDPSSPNPPAQGAGSPNTTSTSSAPAGSSATTPTTSPAAALAKGPDQSAAPSFPVAGGAQPGYGNLDSVSCRSTTQCLAVGADNAGAGVASTSGDGGKSWKSASLPAGVPRLDAVACADTSHCVGVGRGAIATTGDDGSKWTVSAVPIAETTLIGASCPSASECLAVGVTNNPGEPYKGAVTRSTDGGTTWQAVALPQGTLGIGDVVCPSTSDCIAVGASLLVSHDGGATWSLGTVAGGTGSLRSISCSSSTQCVAVGSNPDALENSSAPATAIETSDGGDTWTSMTMPAATATLDQIACASTTQCLAGGASSSPGGPAPLFESSDGGMTWSSAPTAPGGLSAIAALSCPAPNKCAVVGRTRSQNAATAATSDLSSWTSTTLPGDAAPPATGAPS